MPADAYSVRRSERQRDTRRVQDGESCSIQRVDNGDGTFREQRVCEPVYREEPVYDTYCDFTVNRWVPAREVTASGSSVSETPYWPEPRFTCSGTVLGCEREGGRREAYTVLLRAEDQELTCSVSQAAWQHVRLEQTFALQVGVLTGVPDCAPLEAGS
jgi:hypothetical protein